MTYLDHRHVDLLCDVCLRLFTGRLDEKPHALRWRAGRHGWLFFDAKDVCPRCATHYQLADAP